MNILKLIGRNSPLFEEDVSAHESEMRDLVSNARFLVVGGAGSIGQATVKEIFRRNPATLHVVDLSENNLVELVRDIRSSLGYIEGDFQTLPLDCHSAEFDAFISEQKTYDYILNFSALKHVRSEKDPFTLMRLLDVNIFNNDRLAERAINDGSRKFFCVSTDKATNPVNLMGASKRVMELFLMRRSLEVPVSTARFANVAFSDGSLLHGFNQRIQKRQPITAPRDVRRYFVTPEESGELCLLSCLFGDNRDIFFPKLSEKLHLITFSEIAVQYLRQIGYEAHVCETEDEARTSVVELSREQKWPCYFFDSDTTGEKDFEEFFSGQETLDMNRFRAIGIIKNEPVFDNGMLEEFEAAIIEMRTKGNWTRESLVRLLKRMLPELEHKETGKFLDGRM